MANADSHLHLQKYEKRRLGCNDQTHLTTGITTIGDTVIGNHVLDQNMILLPLAIDPLGRFGPILQHFLFDIEPTSPLSFTQKPNLRMLPQCTPKLCASQAQKGYSPWPISIATLQQLTSLSQKHAHFVSITLCVNFMTTLFPPHPQAILIYPPILFWSAGKILKLYYIYIWSFPMSSSPPTLLTILSYYKYSTYHHPHQTQGNMTHISR